MIKKFHLYSALHVYFAACLVIPLMLSAADTGSEGSAFTRYIKPLPQSLAVDSEKSTIGRLLFHDKGLANGLASCATCHKLEHGGGDGLPKSIDIRGGFDDMNTLTVFNAVFNFRLLWNGEAESLADQINIVMNNDRHMGAGWDTALAYIRTQADYQQLFQRSYNGIISEVTVTDALQEFEKTLITPNAPFDRYLRGDNNAINHTQKQGLKLFIDYGCVACHQGMNVGGNMFARFGVFVDPYRNKSNTTKFDLGRFNITGKETDKYVLRVPSLRNVAKTAPYFHDGSTATLKGAVKRMGHYQLGRKIPDEEAQKIVHFLESLTGQWPGAVQ